MEYADPKQRQVRAWDARGSDTAELISLADIVSVARQNLTTLFGLPIAGGLLGLYLALAQTPIYEATTLVQLDPKPTQPLGRGVDLYDPGYDTNSYYYTQLQIIQSRKLAAQLTDRLSLDDNTEFAGPREIPPSRLETWMALLPGMPAAPPPLEVSQEALRDNAIRAVMGSIRADLAPNTTLIRIHFNSRDATLASEAANTLADIYIEELLQARLDIYAKATSWITEKLGEVSTDLSSAESNLQAFRESRELINVGGNRALTEDELREATKRLRDAQRLVIQLNNQYEEIERLTVDPTAISDAQALLLSPVVRDTAQSFVNARGKVRSLEQRYGKRHPLYLDAEATLLEAESNYRNQLRIQKRGLQAELDIARRNEAQLQTTVNRTRQRLQELDRNQFELSMLERSVQSNRQLYDVFMARFNETETNSSFSETNARIADPAVPPRRPAKPDRKRIVLASVLLGLILAIMVTVVRQLLRAEIEHAEDLEALTTIPLVGVVPNSRERGLRRSSVRFMQEHGRAPFSDAVRSIKTAVLMTTGTHPDGGQVLAVSSAEPGEGKTTLCAALGAALANSSRVLLLDADMRRPRLARHLGDNATRTPGLAEVLSGQATIDEAIHQDATSGVFYMPAGKPPPNPGLLLESPACKELLTQARAQFDFVLFDTPPILATSDALHLASGIDGFLLVIRAEQTHKKAVLGALKRMESVNARGTGVILNGAAVRRSAYGGYYYYGSTLKY